MNPSGDPFLTETHGQVGEWLALSYCWGSSSNYTTTTQNLKQHCERMPLSDFPRTLRDAVHITRKLGYRHLWIDSLCIIQNSKEDWEIEAVKMCDVYGSSSLTLAADASLDPSTGIFASAIKRSGAFPYTVTGHTLRLGIKGQLLFSPPIEKI